MSYLDFGLFPIKGTCAVSE